MARHRRLLLVVAFIALLSAAFHFSGLGAHLDANFLRDRFAEHRLGGLLVFTALFALGNLVQVPGSLFLLSAVLALGQFWGGVATYVAACVTCATTYGIIRRLGGNALREFDGRLGRRLFAQLDARPVRSVILLRMVFGTQPAVNYALAMSGVRFRDYLLGTVVGLPFPIAVFCVFFGALARWLHWPIPQGA